jgi:hypothetical protein
MVEEGLYERDVIEKIILFQGKDLLKAVKECQSIEISGFGKLIMSQNKLKKKIKMTGERLNGYNKKLDSDITDYERDSIAFKKIGITEDLIFLKTKLI